MTPILNFDMAINSGNNLFIDEKVRNHSLALSAYRPLSSSKCDEGYYIYIKRHSDRIEEDDPVISVGSIQVKYTS